MIFILPSRDFQTQFSQGVSLCVDPSYHKPPLLRGALSLPKDNPIRPQEVRYADLN